jgi:hypothetical protein
VNLFISAPRLNECAYLGAVLHHWIKEYSERIPFKPQCLRDERDELVAQLLALGEVAQESRFEAGDVFLFVPLKSRRLAPDNVTENQRTLT